uniref:Uncharacterized protein n=1 Tax=Romanomermis culicivorax TaxID=13658 RepID=A0A915KYD0_ROMCU
LKLFIFAFFNGTECNRENVTKGNRNFRSVRFDITVGRFPNNCSCRFRPKVNFQPECFKLLDDPFCSVSSKNAKPPLMVRDNGPVQLDSASLHSILKEPLPRSPSVFDDNLSLVSTRHLVNRKRSWSASSSSSKAAVPTFSDSLKLEHKRLLLTSGTKDLILSELRGYFEDPTLRLKRYSKMIVPDSPVALAPVIHEDFRSFLERDKKWLTRKDEHFCRLQQSVLKCAYPLVAVINEQDRGSFDAVFASNAMKHSLPHIDSFYRIFFMTGATKFLKMWE